MPSTRRRRRRWLTDAEQLGALALSEPDLPRSSLLAVASMNYQDLPEAGDLLSVLQKTRRWIQPCYPSLARSCRRSL